MNAELLWLSIVAAVAVLAAAFVLRRRRAAAAKDAEQASRPAALGDATLAYMEKLFRVRAPVPLVARVDRAYRRPDGELVLVELKTRWSDRAYATDVIQLSAQRMALEGQTGQRVAAHGFVTAQRPKGTAASRSHRVELLDTAKIVALYRRREDVISGRLMPRYVESSSGCRGCAFRALCDGPRR
ncbi:MAG: PD-(D/E)XK nuclease family protein [Rubrivivax sp.]|nr:PD-(D/E)XK nuclease family protein [Burkholderiales bacterium]MCW5633550.1 PD-(D/E)XK nuclease family protein [Rubrivivax sp.]